jgi:hypothetical protein
VIVEATVAGSQVLETRLTAPIFAAIEDHRQSLKPMWRNKLVRAPCVDRAYRLKARGAGHRQRRVVEP